MNTTKELIEQLEKLSNKKVFLKEDKSVTESLSNKTKVKFHLTKESLTIKANQGIIELDSNETLLLKVFINKNLLD